MHETFGVFSAYSKEEVMPAVFKSFLKFAPAAFTFFAHPCKMVLRLKGVVK